VAHHDNLRCQRAQLSVPHSISQWVNGGQTLATIRHVHIVAGEMCLYSQNDDTAVISNFVHLACSGIVSALPTWNVLHHVLTSSDFLYTF